MNTKSILSLLLVSSIALISCKKELEPQESSSSAEVVAPTAETANPNTATAVTPAQMQQNTAVVNPNTPAAPASTAKGMNPAHGQPGHRCDIPVGAPLNSPAGKTAPQATTQLKQSENAPATVTPATISSDGKITPAANSTFTTSNTPAILNAPAATAPGMNPPHGQAGHKCEVAVGAPLPK
ncbi:hypothetical protein [Flavobacterium sp.]|uniref:hypothetical protein n=1 Tax=Flavobacterium sp. TaxID=239 RepID=UPI002B4B2FF8|nr:hypothetical protein [Flavobacterium sp.]HLF51057.1 hypothetical protein [Flavobacterium sp.]